MLGSARPFRLMSGICLTVALVGSGCTGAKEDSPSGGAGGASGISEPSTAQSEPAAIAWSSKLQVVGQPVEAGPALLVLAKSGGGSIELVSLDQATGTTNFTMPFHPGGQPTGVTMAPRATETDAGRHLAVLRQSALGANGPALVAVDVETGTVVSSTPTAIDDYDACSDGHDVCWSGSPRRPGGIIDTPFGPMRDIIRGDAPTRWDLESGRTIEKTLQEGAMKVGDPDLYVRGEGRLATLVRIPGTKQTKWTQSASVLVADDVSAKHGWSFQHDKDDDVYVGSMGKPNPPRSVRRYQQGKRVRTDLDARYSVAGIDGRTGQHLWDREGADPWCPLIHSSGARTLCVVSGLRIDQKKKDTTYDDLTVELQGVDPRTGDVGWTFTLTGEDAERAYVDGRAPLAPSGVVLPSDDGPVALDETTGELESVAADTVVLCAAGPDTVAAYGKDYVADTLYATCGPDGMPVDDELSVFGASALSGEGDVRFVSMPGKVVAYEVG